jgi:uncharacterized protein YifN (PemK superfamily)
MSVETTNKVRQLAEARRVQLQAKLGTDLEQLTRQYAERVEVQKILQSMPPISESESSSRASTAAKSVSTSTTFDPSILPEMNKKELFKLRSDWFEEQVMLVEPQRELENSKSNHQGAVTDMLLRILLISQEAVKAQLGWDDVKINKVARKRLRQILDFNEDNALSSGIVYDMEQQISIDSPLHVTINYFNKMEYNHGD